VFDPPPRELAPFVTSVRGHLYVLLTPFLVVPLGHRNWQVWLTQQFIFRDRCGWSMALEIALQAFKTESLSQFMAMEKCASDLK
jgi:hypothetical protein